MLRFIAAYAVSHRGAFAALAVILTLYGGYAATQGRLDVFPEFVPPQVVIQTEAPGLAPEQVEVLVTRPVEQAVGGIPATERVSSESIAGLSVVTLVFEDSADVYLTRQGVAERLTELSGRLPAGVEAPRMSPLVSSTMDLLKIGLTSDRVTPRELREIADWELRPRLLAVPGVARVTVYGGEQRQLQVAVDPERLAAADSNLTDVVAAARAALGLRGAGQVDLPAQRLPISTAITGDPARVLERAVVASRGNGQVLIRDVARVTDGAAVPFGDAVIQGRPGVLLSISGQYGANTLEATRAVEEAVRTFAPGLKERGIELYPALHRPATFIETALRTLRNALALGAVLIVVVLTAFLRDWRSVLISFLAIPLSLFAAIVVLERFGLSLNTLTLGGFAVALGVLVDDAIIYLENILRRLRENSHLPEPRSRLEVISDASREISGAVVVATGVILLVFLPVFMMSGVQGRFMAPLALAFSLSVVASLVVALTITPALAALLLRVHEPSPEPEWLRSVRRWHHRLLDRAISRPLVVAATLVLLFAAAIAVVPSLAGVFMPSFREGHLVAQVATRVPGTSLREMAAIGERISAELLALPFVSTVEQQIGRAEQGEDTWGPERSEFHIELEHDPRLDQDAAQARIRDVMRHYPAVQSDVMTFLGDRISESLSGETAQGVIQVFGDDLDAIDRASAQIADRISTVRGIADVQVGHSGAAAEVSVNVLPERLEQYGVSAGDVLDSLQTAFQGTIVNQVFDRDRTVDVSVILPREWRTRVDSVGRLPIRAANGQSAMLRDLAQVYVGTGRAAIRHIGGQRFGVVTFNAGSRAIGPVASDVEATLAATALPKGLWLELGGEAVAQRATQRDLVSFTLVALGLIALLLTAAFERRVLSALVMMNLPFSLVGAIAALAVTGQTLSLGALVGLVTVFGISARNSILLLAHYEHLIDREGGGSWSLELIRRGADERLLPVLMTAIVTALGLVPLAIGVGKAGNEIEAPLAIAVLGGLASSTVLSLVVLPALLQWITTSRSARWLESTSRSE
jgi:CzcA family heavy metal efflux pump